MTEKIEEGIFRGNDRSDRKTVKKWFKINTFELTM